MFSVEEKKKISAAVEKVLLDLKHPEMPTGKPEFKLHVNGAAVWSWADIEPNWHYEDKEPSVNPFNEQSREIHKTMEE